METYQIRERYKFKNATRIEHFFTIRFPKKFNTIMLIKQSKWTVWKTNLNNGLQK